MIISNEAGASFYTGWAAIIRIAFVRAFPLSHFKKDLCIYKVLFSKHPTARK